MGILSLFDTYYAEAPDGAPNPGDVYWVPVPETSEVPRILEVQRSTPEAHTSIDFEFVELARHHFTKRDDRLPIKLLQLSATEELLVSRGKKRLCVVLGSAVVSNLSEMPKQEQRLAKHMGKAGYIVAPFFSAATQRNPGSFMPQFVARIRAMMYPHLFSLPNLEKPKAVHPIEIIRFDRLFVTYLGRGCNRSGVRVDPEVFELMAAQLRTLFGGEFSELYSEARELCLEALPTIEDD